MLHIFHEPEFAPIADHQQYGDLGTLRRSIAKAWGRCSLCIRDKIDRIALHPQRPTQQARLTAIETCRVEHGVALLPTRSILKSLNQSSKRRIVFYGSQTGTAEGCAHRFAQEALEKYGLGCVIADLEDYDFVDLAKLSEEHLAVCGDAARMAKDVTRVLGSTVAQSITRDECVQ